MYIRSYLPPFNPSCIIGPCPLATTVPVKDGWDILERLYKYFNLSDNSYWSTTTWPHSDPVPHQERGWWLAADGPLTQEQSFRSSIHPTHVGTLGLVTMNPFLYLVQLSLYYKYILAAFLWPVNSLSFFFTKSQLKMSTFSVNFLFHPADPCEVA